MSESHFLSLAKSRMKEERRKGREEERGEKRKKKREGRVRGRVETQKYFHVSKVIKSNNQGKHNQRSGKSQHPLPPVASVPTPAIDSRQEHKKLSSTKWGRNIQAAVYE